MRARNKQTSHIICKASQQSYEVTCIEFLLVSLFIIMHGCIIQSNLKEEVKNCLGSEVLLKKRIEVFGFEFWNPILVLKVT